MTAKLRVMVVDDEPLARSNVVSSLRGDVEVEVVGQCGVGAEAAAMVRSLKPDVLFLDVQMPECDGFDVLQELGADAPVATVFVTAYDQYALKAFEAGALDYLLKPFDTARFGKALERAKQAASSARGKRRRLERIAIKGAGQVSFVGVDEIDWIEAADYYAALHVGPRTHLLRRTLAELEKDLDAELFVRVHRSTIVNVARVKALESGEDGEAVVVLVDGTQLRLSRRYRKPVQDRLGL